MPERVAQGPSEAQEAHSEPTTNSKTTAVNGENGLGTRKRAASSTFAMPAAKMVKTAAADEGVVVVDDADTRGIIIIDD